MNPRSFIRDALLVAVAVLAGWWLRSADTAVLAQHSTSSSSARDDGGAGLSFQFGSGRPEDSLTVYNPASRTLYVYPRVGTGNSHISCQYMFHVKNPGGPIDRENCAVGPLY